MCGQGKAAIYTIVYQLSMIMMIIRTGINGAYTPWLYYSIRDQRYKRVRSITKDLAIIMAVITVGIMAIGPELLRLAAPISYYEAVRDIPAIMIGCHFIFIYLLFANVEIYYEQKKYVSLASVATAIINIILNYICIPKFGYLVAGYTTLVSYILMACMHYAFLKRLEKKHKEIGEIFDIKQLFCASFYVLVAGCLLFLVYDNIVIRWTIILIVAICAYCNRKKIENLLSSIKRK
jgi:O-antigen/teichoic acid export membrane protein